MELIHLSDLHIGKRVNEVSMIEDQAHILDQIIEIIDIKRPDGIMIAGDVYDKSVPSAEAVTLFDDFLSRIAKRKIPTFIISGNHDSAERLAFSNRLMSECGIHFSPVYDGHIAPITIRDQHGDVNFWLLPFLKPAHVRRFYPDDNIETYTDAVRIVIREMNIDQSVRNVLIVHQFVTGASSCESEEISVGGTDNVDASVFDGFDYVALGHIHGPQNIGSNRIRYCGTPLKYSFSEENHQKSVTAVHLSDKGELSINLHPLTPLHDLRSIRGKFSEITSKAYYERSNCDDYLHIILTDEEDIPEAIGRLRAVYPNVMKLSYDNTRTQSDHVIDGIPEVQNISPLTLFDGFYELQNNQPMSDQQRDFVRNLIETIWEDNA